MSIVILFLKYDIEYVEMEHFKIKVLVAFMIWAPRKIHNLVL